MVYLTHYEEYPVYEPAEGGYYYAGNQVVAWERLSLRQAKKKFKEIWEEYDRQNVEAFGKTYSELCENGCKDEYGCRLHPWHLVEPKGDRAEIRFYSQYIGEGESYVIERKLGSQERGWEPYC